MNTIDNNSDKEYILSSDMDNIIIIWNVNNFYELKFFIKTEYANYIYSSIILFDVNNNDYIITSTTGKHYNKKDYSRLYSLDNGAFIKNIYGTNDNNTIYIIPWYNSNNNETYIVEFCRYNITINNIFKEEIYFIFEKKNDYNKYYSGFIYINNKNGKNLLYSCSFNGAINIWDLFNKKLELSINIGYSKLYSLIKWNDKYGICGDNTKGEIIIIDLERNILISKIKNVNVENIICLKKYFDYHNGESLIVLSENSNVSLWISNKFI